jgi:hypothetical protein
MHSSSSVPVPYLLFTCGGCTNNFILHISAMSFFHQ